MEEEQGRKSNFVRYMSNPKAFTLKKWFVELLQEEYPPHDNIIERVSTSLITEQDLKEFGKLVTTVYERAYKKAVSDYREQAEALGVKINIVGKSN